MTYTIPPPVLPSEPYVPLSAQRRPPVLVDHVELRPAEYQALLDGRRARLTVREFEILLVLAERHDRVVRRGEIYGEVWGGQMPHRDRSVDVFVRKLRAKLHDASPDWVYVHTHYGIGYRFHPEPAGEVDETVADGDA